MLKSQRFLVLKHIFFLVLEFLIPAKTKRKKKALNYPPIKLCMKFKYKYLIFLGSRSTEQQT